MVSSQSGVSMLHPYFFYQNIMKIQYMKPWLKLHKRIKHNVQYEDNKNVGAVNIKTFVVKEIYVCGFL